MAAFKTLQDVSASFENHLKHLSSSLFCARVGESAEEVVAKKLRDLCFFSSKYHLLHAKEAASTKETAERVQNGADVLAEYERTAQGRVLERCAVRALVRSRAVQALLTTPDRKLSAELLDRKRNILARLSKLRALDSELRQLDSVLLETQEEHAATRSQWDATLGELRTRSLASTGERTDSPDGPLESKLQSTVDKMELMRQLIAKLVTSRGGSYDWLSDPHRRMEALHLTRRAYSVQAYTGDSLDDSSS